MLFSLQGGLIGSAYAGFLLRDPAAGALWGIATFGIMLVLWMSLRPTEESASGRELVEKGWREDVLYASGRNLSDVVPVLRGGAFDELPAG